MDQFGVVVVDFGGQLTENIARHYFESGIPVEIIPWDEATPYRLRNAKGVILSGSLRSVYEPDSPKLKFNPIEMAKNGRGILGLCYGEQLLAHTLGGRVGKGERGEYGFAELEYQPSKLFEGVESKIIWMSHRDQVIQLPPEFKVTGKTRDCPVAAYEHEYLPIFGLQFHPESSHTENGYMMLNNFGEICGCHGSGWDVNAAIDNAIIHLRKTVKKGKALMACSGGVDSTTTAVLAKKALGDGVKVVYVDNGLMRKDETQEVQRNLTALGVDVEVVDASNIFLSNLKGVMDPEKRRKIIGSTFWDVFPVCVDSDTEYLIQGTIAPDRIETVKGAREGGIKTHHNLVPHEKMRLQVVEPIRELFKYQVRMLAAEVLKGSPIASRQPFPGPGLGVRCAPELNQYNLDLLREATVYVDEAFAPFKPAQYFAILLNNKTTSMDEKAEAIVREYMPIRAAWRLEDKGVGVKGDERAYQELLMLDVGGVPQIPYFDVLRMQADLTGKLDVCRVGILVEGQPNGPKRFGVMGRSVETKDFMTSRPTWFPVEVLHDAGRKVTMLPDVAWFSYEITTKPSSTTELY